MQLRYTYWLLLCALLPHAVCADERPTAAPDNPAAVQEQHGIPDTITLRTGGGDSIEKRPVDLFRKTQWRFSYTDAPAIEQIANASLGQAGYDVADGKRIGWQVQTLFLGPPDQYVPYTPKKGISAGTIERIVRGAVGAVAGVAAPMPTVFRANLGASIMTGQTLGWKNAAPLTDDMLEGLPLGAKRVLVTRVVNPFYRATQDVMTVAYSDVTDDDLRWLNAYYVFQLIELKTRSDKQFGAVREANDVCRNAWAYSTGKKPQPIAPILATVEAVTEAELTLSPGEPKTEGADLRARPAATEASSDKATAVPVVQIVYRPEGATEARRLFLPKDSAPKVATDDQIRIVESLFGVQVTKVAGKRRVQASCVGLDCVAGAAQ